jgi:3-oxoacyl-[acyl-carrier protein] reductase
MRHPVKGHRPVPDRYLQLINTAPGRAISARLGLPRPPLLERHRPGQPVIDRTVLLGAPSDGRLAGPVATVLAAIGAEVATPMELGVRSAVAGADLDAAIFNPDAPGDRRFKALVLDATGLKSPAQLVDAYAFLHPAIRRVRHSGRVVVLGTPPEACEHDDEAIAQRSLEGLVRAVAKELRAGATAQLVYVAPGADGQLESTLRFLLSPRSAYVDGQVVRLSASAHPPDGVDWASPLSGRRALVTGAARGIGAAIAELLTREGAHVVGLDVDAASSQLETRMAALGGSALTADIGAPGAPDRIADNGPVDIVVHNAGITRDRTLGRMTERQWTSVLSVNLAAPARINEALLERGALGDGGRVVCISSISGIAGNAGQTNYATSKAGVIGLVQTCAPALARRGITINAVAPGFIETQMTDAMPFALREAGRRLSSLRQGGLPVDVAETVAWLASPASAAVTGNIVRVCGQSLLGA